MLLAEIAETDSEIDRLRGRGVTFDKLPVDYHSWFAVISMTLEIAVTWVRLASQVLNK